MRLLSYYLPTAPKVLTYMLQQVNYNPKKFGVWAAALPSLNSVMKRQKLILTNRSKLMLGLAYIGWFLPVFIGIAYALSKDNFGFLALATLAPLISFLCLIVPTFFLQKLVVDPAYGRNIAAAKQKLETSSAERIAVMGSYGKTTMKELLLTVLSEGKKVAATPGNKNIPASHASWINNKLSGSEEVLIFEYGESDPGDIANLADISKPSYAVVTGLAPAHLDGYGTLQAVVDDFASIRQSVAAANIFVNGEINSLKEAFVGSQLYTNEGTDSQRIQNVKISFEGMDFTLASGDKKQNFHTDLIGKHLLGPLCAVVAIAQKLGLTDSQIKQGIAKTKPYEHRMQPRQLHGAWLIDDTYNGTIEGMRAGLELLRELPAKRTIYVTPGLVDQGDENERVHKELGGLITQSNPDKVVLMRNSVTGFIKQGMVDYKGDLVIEDDPLGFYTNLEHVVAAGDVVMMQNDWPDSYK